MGGDGEHDVLAGAGDGRVALGRLPGQRARDVPSTLLEGDADLAEPVGQLARHANDHLLEGARHIPGLGLEHLTETILESRQVVLQQPALDPHRLVDLPSGGLQPIRQRVGPERELRRAGLHRAVQFRADVVARG